MSLEFPSFVLETGKPILWKGEPLTRDALKDVLFAARISSKFTEADTAETARERWEQASQLLNATIDRLPSMDELGAAIQEIPDGPSPPRPFAIEKPHPDSRYFGTDYAEELNSWNARKQSYEKGVQVYHQKMIAYERQLPAFRKGVETWRKLGGGKGILATRRIRLKLSEVLDEIESNLNITHLGVLGLLFELLPVGLWGSHALAPHLGSNGWDITKIVPDRIDHLVSLNPMMVYRGKMSQGYRDYLLFLFGSYGPALLETPIHGNATYVLHRNWLELCRRSKGDLMHHPDVTRIIHHDMHSWRHEVCRVLRDNPPSHSNEY